MSRAIISSALLALSLTCSPALASANDLRSTSSSDIMAEIEFLERILPDPPPNIRVTNQDEQSILDFLASYAICESWDYDEYTDVASSFKRMLQPFAGSRDLYITLFENSYLARADNGCNIDQEDRHVFENIFGDVERLNLSIQRQDKIKNAIRERRKEMVRRTLGPAE